MAATEAHGSAPAGFGGGPGHDADRPPEAERPRPSRRRADRRSLLLVPGVLLLLAGLIGPILVLLGYSFGLLGEDTPAGFSRYVEVLGDSFYLGVMFRTLRMATIITVVALLLGYPLALAIARSTGFQRTLLIAVVVTPLLTNIVVRSLGWLVILSPHGVVISLFEWLGIGYRPQFIGTTAGVTIALAHIGLPLVVLPMLTSLEREDPSRRDAALVHGAHPIVAWWRVTLPLSAPGIVAGATLVFVLGVAALITPLMIGKARTFVLSTLMVQQIGLLQWGRAAALALSLFVIVLLVAVILRRISARFNPDRNRSRSAAMRYRPMGPVMARINRLPVFPRLSRVVRNAFLTVVIIYILFPLAVVIKSAFDTSQTMHAGFDGFTLQWFADAFDSDLYLPSLLLSLRLAGLAIVIGFIVALPASVAIVRGRFRGRSAIYALMLSPLLLPHSALAVGFVLFFQYLGIGPSIWRLLLGHLVVVLPWVVAVLVTALESVDPSLEEAASSLGARHLRVLRRITLPLIATGLFSAVLFAFIISFDEATISVLVAGSATATLPVKIFSEIQIEYNPAIAAISAALIFVVVLVLVPLERRLGLLTQRGLSGD